MGDTYNFGGNAERYPSPGNATSKFCAMTKALEALLIAGIHSATILKLTGGTYCRLIVLTAGDASHEN